MDVKLKHAALTKTIIQAFYDVYNSLGYGFSENIYENSLAIKLAKQGLNVQQQKPAQVFFEGQNVGEYFMDVVVNDLIIIELKAVKTLTSEHEAQLLNYLKATRFEVGLLLNFGTRPQIKRRAFDNENKGNLGWVKNTSDAD